MRFELSKKTEKEIPKQAVWVVLNDGKETTLAEKDNGSFVLKVGVGQSSKMTRRSLVTLCRKIIRVAKSQKKDAVAIRFKDFIFSSVKETPERMAEIIAINFILADFEFNQFKSDKKEFSPVKSVFVLGANEAVKRGFKKGVLIGQEVNKCRALANTPGGDITPEKLAEAARAASKGTGVRVKVLNEVEMKKLKMGAVLGVSKGSKEEGRFIILEYWGADKNSKEKPIVLVGKGVTFDSGGLSLKPSDGMVGMHLDMSGGAVVIHSVILAAKLGIKKNIIGLVPAVENMPGRESLRPGDILHSMSGKTIEVLNTDAEGRLILADALTYAKKYSPKVVIDVATLTGAALVALGERASAIFSKDKKLETLLEELGEQSGDYVWPLPLWEEYEEEVKSSFADLANVNPKVRWGGTIQAAIFLYQFAKDYPWVHIDMAPRMTSIRSDNLGEGATGEPMKLLITFLEKY